MQYKILKMFLKIPYFFLKIIPINEKKIVFISRQGNKPSIDFILLKDEILKMDSNYKVIFLCERIRKERFGYLKYLKTVFKQMYHLATSRICVTDGYNVTISTLNHKKKLKIIQMWHAIATVKQFGYQTIGKKYGRSKKIAEGLNMHNKYDYVISGSKAMKPIFEKTFNVPKRRIKNTGTPRIDYILNNCNNISKEIYEKYPNLKDKNVILYAPTFRKDEKINIDKIIETIDFNKYNLIVKTHPTRKQKFIDKKIYTCDEYSTMQLLTVADYVITDYSAISIEAALLNKPVYFYTYDYDQYVKNNGLNIDIKNEMKGLVFKNFKNLYKKLDESKYNFRILNKYRDKYVDNQKGTSTYILANYIVNGKWINY